MYCVFAVCVVVIAEVEGRKMVNLKDEGGRAIGRSRDGLVETDYDVTRSDSVCEGEEDTLKMVS
jgi:hypothetical protein